MTPYTKQQIKTLSAVLGIEPDSDDARSLNSIGLMFFDLRDSPPHKIVKSARDKYRTACEAAGDAAVALKMLKGAYRRSATFRLWLDKMDGGSRLADVLKDDRTAGLANKLKARSMPEPHRPGRPANQHVTVALMRLIDLWDACPNRKGRRRTFLKAALALLEYEVHDTTLEGKIREAERQLGMRS